MRRRIGNGLENEGGLKEVEKLVEKRGGCDIQRENEGKGLDRGQRLL